METDWTQRSRCIDRRMGAKIVYRNKQINQLEKKIVREKNRKHSECILVQIANDDAVI